jgi:predicted transcriptional regulator
MMQISLEPNLDAWLNRIASEAGKAGNQVVEELAANYIDHDTWFKQEVNRGLLRSSGTGIHPAKSCILRVHRLSL